MEKVCKEGVFNINDDKSVLESIVASQTLVNKYNTYLVTDFKERTELIHQILGEAKGFINMMPPVHFSNGYNTYCGENFQSNFNLTIFDAAKVTFGDNIMIGPNCGFYTSGHDMDPKRRREGWNYCYPITVGNDVFFGAGTIVLSSKPGGITIGDGAFIGAGSVVTGDIPAHCLAAGNPCKVIRMLEETEE
uniref:Acetyltransferase n=1 Tax=Eubacterium cellulosolvens (strain ATCC 43171 / JCM 9499 / 6) TaxID=633697 RepID=I5AWZ6_EUBC6